jgi:formamidopyrimidine-DNA glycosylase
MPELPEVETVRRGLESLIAGATLERSEVLRPSAVRLLPGGDREFASRILGTRIVSVARRGKFLWMPLDDGAALSAHLGMSGQFRVHEGPWDEAPVPHPHCRVRLALLCDGVPLTLDFLDQRTFGYLHAEPMVPTPDALPGGVGSELAAVPVSVAHIGRDALDPALDPATASVLWRRGTRGIKQVLLDQTRVSGIGNIYADEALWLARIHPVRPADRVSAAQARELFGAVRAVMESALAQGGTSFDALYVNVNGESGYFARDLEAYARAGKPCSRCGTALRRAVIGGRSTHWCPRCQRLPRTQPMSP